MFEDVVDGVVVAAPSDPFIDNVHVIIVNMDRRVWGGGVELPDPPPVSHLVDYIFDMSSFVL